MISYFEIKKNLFKIILIGIIFTILFKQIDFFKKVYFTLTRTHDQRLVNSYEYCGGESIGFLNYIKNNFKIKYQVPIINYDHAPNPRWYFSDLEIIKTNKVILLNHEAHNITSDTEKDIKFPKDLNSYKIIYQHKDCYFLEKND